MALCRGYEMIVVLPVPQLIAEPETGEEGHLAQIHPSLPHMRNLLPHRTFHQRAGQRSTCGSNAAPIVAPDQEADDFARRQLQ